MTYYEHALMSVRKFGNPGLFDTYLEIHKWLDKSKMWYPNSFRHRILFHHTYGVELLINEFGNYISNGTLVRDIGFAHLREDHGIIPTLYDWWKGCGSIGTYEDFKSFIQECINNEYVDDLEFLKFNERWMYVPNRMEIKWLNSEERKLIENECK